MNYLAWGRQSKLTLIKNVLHSSLRTYMILNTSKYVANELNAKLFKHLSQKVETSAVSISLFCFFQEDVNQVGYPFGNSYFISRKKVVKS